MIKSQFTDPMLLANGDSSPDHSLCIQLGWFTTKYSWFSNKTVVCGRFPIHFRIASKSNGYPSCLKTPSYSAAVGGRKIMISYFCRKHGINATFSTQFRRGTLTVLKSRFLSDAIVVVVGGVQVEGGATTTSR